MSNGPKVGEKKKFNLPHVFIILFAIMLICAIATYIIPAGTFDYHDITMEDGSTRSVATPGTWHAYEKGAEGSPTPVGPFRLFELVYEGMCNAADISFLVFITYCSVTFIIKSGAFEGAVGALLRVFKGNSSLITIPIFIALIGAGSSTVGMFEEWLPFIPVFAAIYTGMGYDALTGLMVIAFGAGMGYSGAIMNPFTVGVAQGIAEVPYMSGTAYRLICHAVMIIIASIFIIRYAIKVKKDPENSYVYGIEGLVRKEGEEIDHHAEFKLSHKLILLDLLAAIVVVVVGVMKWGWHFSQI
ncbi:MAG: YfcC family protein, partial [Firmicutes bacterium]|nr:YfcC family protein [Bacillota bacterium]